MVGDHMEYLLGLLIGVVFCCVLATVLLIGYRLGRKKPDPEPVKDDVLRHQEQLKKDFQELMNYDVERALQRKQVD